MSPFVSRETVARTPRGTTSGAGGETPERNLPVRRGVTGHDLLLAVGAVKVAKTPATSRGITKCIAEGTAATDENIRPAFPHRRLTAHAFATSVSTCLSVVAVSPGHVSHHALAVILVAPDTRAAVNGWNVARVPGERGPNFPIRVTVAREYGRTVDLGRFRFTRRSVLAVQPFVAALFLTCRIFG